MPSVGASTPTNHGVRRGTPEQKAVYLGETVSCFAPQDRQADDVDFPGFGGVMAEHPRGGRPSPRADLVLSGWDSRPAVLEAWPGC